MQLPEDHPAAREIGDLISRVAKQSFIHGGGAAVESLPPALQTAIRAGNRSARTSTSRSPDNRHAASRAHRYFGDVVSRVARTNTTAASCRSKTFTDCTTSKLPRDI